MLIPVGYAQINLKFTGVGAPFGAQMTFGVQNENEETPSEVIDDVIQSVTTADLFGNVSSAVGVTSILCKLGPNKTGGMLELPANLPGKVGAQASPPQVCYLVRKTTLTGGRMAQGRWFIPGVPEAGVDASGIVSNEYVTATQTALDSFLNQLQTRGIPMFLLHTDEASGMEPIPVARLAMQTRVATQRRRLRG